MILALIALNLVICVCAVFAYYIKHTPKCPSNARMDGKVVIITGGNSGVGLETARDLVRRGANVIIACRSPERGSAAVRDILNSLDPSFKRQQQQLGSVRYQHLDLSSFASVRTFATNILNTETQLDVLLNNAATVPMMTSKPILTENGLDLQWQTNYFAHFLLTLLLLPLLAKTQHSRIINVVSSLYKYGRIEWSNFDQHRVHETALQVYSNTKMALVLFTRHLAATLQGTGVVAICGTPGITNTDIGRSAPWIIRKTVGAIWGTFFCRTATMGAQTLIYMAVEHEIDDGFGNGQFFTDCSVETLTKSASDPIIGQNFFQLSEKIVKETMPSLKN